MTKVKEKIELKAQIAEYCLAKGISKADFAVKAGVSPATLSAIEGEQWEKISPKMVNKLRSVLGRETTGKLVSTADFEAVVRLCDCAKANHLMIGLIGDTGTGKTTSLTHYAKQSNVYRITFEKSMNPRNFFSGLIREMGVDYEGSTNAMIAKVADELNSRESSLLIIDEAGKITHPIMLYLHDLREKTKENCGIIMAGMPYFKANLQKFASKGKEGVSEFFRRINLWHKLDGLTPSEAKYVANMHGITDSDQLRELKGFKRFGDLMNEILLEKIINENV